MLALAWYGLNEASKGRGFRVPGSSIPYSISWQMKRAKTCKNRWPRRRSRAGTATCFERLRGGPSNAAPCQQSGQRDGRLLYKVTFLTVFSLRSSEVRTAAIKREKFCMYCSRSFPQASLRGGALRVGKGKEEE